MNSLQIHYTCMARSAKVLSDTCQPRCKSLRRTSGVSQISVSIVSLPVSGACKGACIETMARNEKQKPGHSLCADVTSESCTGANQSPCSTTYVFVIPNTKGPIGIQEPIQFHASGSLISTGTLSNTTSVTRTHHSQDPSLSTYMEISLLQGICSV